MPEPDLQIKGEAGGGHPDPEIRGTGSSHKKTFFDPASVWSQNKGRGGGVGGGGGAGSATAYIFS